MIAAFLYGAFGEPRDAGLLGASVVVILFLDLYQQDRAERAVEALLRLADPEVVVVRDGGRRKVPARELVRGDLVVLAAGDRVPGDGHLVRDDGILLDESILTGESVPVHKTLGGPGSAWVLPGGDGLPFVYAQTLVIAGGGLAELRATGGRTEVSRIARALAAVEPETPLLVRQTRRLVATITVLAAVLSIVVVLTLGFHTGDWVAAGLAGLALAIALVPEEIPVVLTVYTVLGAHRMAERRALARRFSALATLGAVTVLCTDKTGTLTTNRMRVSVLRATPDSSTPDPADPRQLRLREAVFRASDPVGVDPMEAAMAGAGQTSSEPKDPRGAAERIREYPFDVARLSSGAAWRGTALAATGCVIFVKGAPEAILTLARVAPQEAALWRETVEALAREGQRVLAVATAPVERDPPPDRYDGLPFTLLGLVALEDPLRPGVPEALAACRSAGIRVILLTGDYPATATAIARRSGIDGTGRVLTGAETDRMGDEELSERLREIRVFARVRPEVKQRIVRLLRGQGEVVAMTGDGINDAPALRGSDVGIAMGLRGTDVAREAADLVLLDDAFPTIVEAIAMGRRIYANMRKAMAYLIAVHVAIAGLALVPVLLGLPPVIYPVEIVFLEMIIDPASSLSFEAEPPEPDAMRRGPRLPDAPIFAGRAIAWSCVEGGLALGSSVGIYLGAVILGHPIDESRALAFTTLFTSNLALVAIQRSFAAGVLTGLRRINPVFLTVLAGGMLFAAAADYAPPVMALFGFASPSLLDLTAAVAVGAASVLVFDPFKRRLEEPTLPVDSRADAEAIPAP
ncbi:MAG: cation-translocating P-type ATPase [Thermoplasmata archaeon]|nr:cation-translocating P-type ATPase [Thermoplasmata archaeon]